MLWKPGRSDVMKPKTISWISFTIPHQRWPPSASLCSPTGSFSPALFPSTGWSSFGSLGCPSANIKKKTIIYTCFQSDSGTLK